MQLHELPTEVISRICRHIGVTFTESTRYEDEWTVSYKNADFQALRLSCKDIYHKTGYDAAARYSLILEEIEILSSLSSFSHLLRLSSQPAMRDRIHTIYLLDAACIEDAPVKADERARAEEFQISDQAAQLLAECLHNLGSGKCLERIEPVHNSMTDLLLHAMSLCSFPRPLAVVPLCPNHLARVGYPHLAEAPQAYLPYIKNIQIQPFLSYAPNGPGDYKAGDENVNGYHVKGYRPTSPEFSKLITAFRVVNKLEYHGCRAHPALRFCDGCDDFFAKTFAPILFHNLTNFEVNGVFISGGRLRAFIKKHTNSLVSISMTYVNLTDGSWRSIAQGLAKLPHLKKMTFWDIRQRHKATSAKRPKGYLSHPRITFSDMDDIQHFLGVFITYFGTTQHLNPKRFRKSIPIWYQAKLFSLGTYEGLFYERTGAEALKRYAEVEDMD